MNSDEKVKPDCEQVVRDLIIAAGKQSDSADAMRFTQAALNAANALSGLNNMKR